MNRMNAKTPVKKYNIIEIISILALSLHKISGTSAI